MSTGIAPTSTGPRPGCSISIPHPQPSQAEFSTPVEPPPRSTPGPAPNIPKHFEITFEEWRQDHIHFTIPCDFTSNTVRVSAPRVVASGLIEKFRNDRGFVLAMARDERREVLVLATNTLTANHIRAEAASIINRFRNVTRVHIANAMLLPRSKLAEAISTHVGDIVCTKNNTQLLNLLCQSDHNREHGYAAFASVRLHPGISLPVQIQISHDGTLVGTIIVSPPREQAAPPADRPLSLSPGPAAATRPRADLSHYFNSESDSKRRSSDPALGWNVARNAGPHSRGLRHQQQSARPRYLAGSRFQPLTTLEPPGDELEWPALDNRAARPQQQQQHYPLRTGREQPSPVTSSSVSSSSSSSSSSLSCGSSRPVLPDLRRSTAVQKPISMTDQAAQTAQTSQRHNSRDPQPSASHPPQPAGLVPLPANQVTLQAEDRDPQTAGQAPQQESPQRADSSGTQQADNNGSHPAESHGSSHSPTPDDQAPQQPPSAPATTAQAQDPPSQADLGPADDYVPSQQLTRSRSRARDLTAAHSAASQALAASTARARAKSSAKTSKSSGKNSSPPQPPSLPPGPSQDQRSAPSSHRR